MLNDLFDEFMILSANLRKEYPKSLGEKTSNWEENICSINTFMPELFQVIYNKVSGTKRNIHNEKLMDFIPGYRLIHILELADETAKFNNLYDNDDDKILKVIPFLANYSSDFICCCKMSDGREAIASIMHDDGEGLITMHESNEKFLKTLCEFYKQQAYFLDSDGYLDYDMDKEEEIASKI